MHSKLHSALAWSETTLVDHGIDKVHLTIIIYRTDQGPLVTWVESFKVVVSLNFVYFSILITKGSICNALLNSGSWTEVTYFGNRKIVKFAQMSYFWWGISWYGWNLHISANCWEKRNYVNFWLSPRFSPKMENQVWLTPWMVLKKTNDLTRIGQACWFQK